MGCWIKAKNFTVLSAELIQRRYKIMFSYFYLSLVLYLNLVCAFFSIISTKTHLKDKNILLLIEWLTMAEIFNG